jgi:glycosyltransferase involved in cell wall biosynthesis
MHQKKAVFMTTGNFSNVNISVLQELTNNFPDICIDVIDISAMISKKDMISLFYCIKEYGLHTLLDKKTTGRLFRRTPYIFNKIKNQIKNKSSDIEYVFTFQTQSIFDLSLPEIPHFVYTDHTHLENLRYPNFNHHELACDSWIECEKSIYQNATFNFTMSTNISKSIIEDYSCSPQKVSCVYCGSNIHLSKEDLTRNKVYSNKNILFVGIDWQRKGGPTLAKAFKMVLDIYPDATLTIVGASPQLDIPNCEIVGRIPLPDVKRFYEQTSIFCLPTEQEPFGIVFLEAMAHKLPIIGTNIGAIPDFIEEGKNGYVIEPKNVFQLAQKIINLIEFQEKCKSFGEYGFKKFMSRYNWKEAGRKMCKTIRKIIAYPG